eukprot:m.52932 g.52932  ORF g.52932 m.52932 type:complete len:67 (+) comp34237_c0_seq1:670-870(+)
MAEKLLPKTSSAIASNASTAKPCIIAPEDDGKAQLKTIVDELNHLAINIVAIPGTTIQIIDQRAYS